MCIRDRAVSVKKEWQSVDSLYSIRAWMGSQWRVLRNGETCSRLWALKTSLAAANRQTFFMCSSHIVCDVETKIFGRRRKRYFTATDRDGSRFGDWKGLRRWAQEEGLCFIIVKFVFQHPGLDVWQTGFQRRYCRLNVRWRDRDLELSIVRERLRLNQVT